MVMSTFHKELLRLCIKALNSCDQGVGIRVRIYLTPCCNWEHLFLLVTIRKVVIKMCCVVTLCITLNDEWILCCVIISYDECHCMVMNKDSVNAGPSMNFCCFLLQSNLVDDQGAHSIRSDISDCWRKNI